jgi:hypothetical protein
LRLRSLILNPIAENVPAVRDYTFVRAILVLPIGADRCWVGAARPNAILNAVGNVVCTWWEVVVVHHLIHLLVCDVLMLLLEGLSHLENEIETN